MSYDDHMDETEAQVWLFQCYINGLSDQTSYVHNAKQLAEHFKICHDELCEVCTFIQSMLDELKLVKPKKFSSYLYQEPEADNSGANMPDE